ncbi:MAG: glycine cleavage system protein GcvH [Cyanobacteriota bacterium]|nr:glycine cleavage system protein GcvH [Cyanobacteriota bacterium]
MALEYPPHLKYLDSHEYIRVVDDIAVIGITAYAVEQLGDIVFVGLPEEGTSLQKGDTFGSVESVKAVEDLYSPLTGEVVAINQVVVDNPESIADDPYGDGWLLKVKIDNPEDLDDSMSADSYASMVEG